MTTLKFLFLLVLSTSCQTVFSQDVKFTDAANCFTLQLLRQIQLESETGIVSPFSVDSVLSMLLLGTSGDTTNELISVLQAQSITIEEIKQGFRLAMQKLTSNNKVTVSIANAMWIDQGYTVKADYKTAIQDNFMADQRSGDFKNNSAKATDDINDWVKDKTKSMIEKLFDKPLDRSTIMVLLNAIYFKGQWLHQFGKKNTKNLAFYNGGDKSKSKMVPFMNQQREFAYKYDPDMKAKVLRMDYTGQSMSFVAFLPNEGVELSESEKKINCDTIRNVLNIPTLSEVDVTMPKFETTSEIELEEALKKMGLNLVFNGGDLSGIGPGNLALSKIVQKAKIKVNEEGTEAAAVTGGGVSATSDEEEPEFQQFFANRPFCYFIIDQESGLILFAGKQSQF